MSNTVKNQPMYIAEDGLVRFKENHVVRHLLEKARVNTDEMLAKGNFSDEDKRQFMQLLGYTVVGYIELPYVSAEQQLEVLKDGTIFVQEHLKKEARAKWELANNINKTGE